MASVQPPMDDDSLVRQLDKPGVRIILVMPIGPALVGEWTWREIFTSRVPEWIFQPDPPYWLSNGEIIWHHPLQPIEYRGRVRLGLEDVARTWMADEHQV